MIDFREIPYSSTNGDPDLFEKFCCEFLEILGYEIMDPPSRGADGGIDIKVRDIKRESDNSSITRIDWLVSCKHFANSGKSVGINDEQNIRDRLEQHKCVGFIGLYTTIASSGLVNKLKGQNIPHALFNSTRFEKILLGLYSREKVFARYFPNSFKNWKETYNYTEPVKLFTEYLKNDEDSLLHDLENYFGSIDNVIKPIKKLDSFKEMFEENDISYCVTPLLNSPPWNNYRTEDIHREIDIYNQESDTDFLPTFWSLYNSVIPKILFNTVGIQTNFQRLQSYRHQVSTGGEDYIFPNYFFLNEETDKFLIKKFSQYKSILK